MFVVEKINNILQSIYVYVPQEVLIIILAGLTILMYDTIKNGQKKINQIHYQEYHLSLTSI